MAMETTASGTSVGVDNPYDHVERCDYLTDDGRCRFAIEHADRDPSFARARNADDYDCPVGTSSWEWRDCPKFQSIDRSHECVRCGIAEVRMAHDDDRPLLEIHHLSYRRDDSVADTDAGLAHEITVELCRWCHAKVHNAWARIDDDVNPATEAIAEQQARRSKEHAEFGFHTAAERHQE